MLWMSCRRSRESFSRYTRLLRTAAAYWEKVVSWLLLAASAASLVRLAAQPEPGNMAVQASSKQPDLTWKGGLPWEVIALFRVPASAAQYCSTVGIKHKGCVDAQAVLVQVAGDHSKLLAECQLQMCHKLCRLQPQAQ